MEVLTLIAGFAAAIWGLVLAMRGSPLAGCLAFLVTLSCFSTNFLSIPIGGTTFTLDRILLLGLIGGVAVQWRMGLLQLRPFHWVDGVILAFVGWLTLSMLTHDWRTPYPGDAPVLPHLINGYLVPMALYFIARQAMGDDEQKHWLLGGLTAFGVYLALTGVLEGLRQYSLVFPHYIADPQLGLHFGRARGPMVHSVSYGIYLATCFFAAWLWRSQLARHWQVIVIAVLPIFAAAVFYTKTRSVWFGTGTGLLILAALALEGKWRWLLVGSVVAGGLLVSVAKVDDLLGIQREGTVQDSVQSADMRRAFTFVSWKMFQDRPIEGFGFCQFYRAKLPYLGDASTDLKLFQIRGYVHHNTFLAILTETGLIGLAGYLTIIGAWAYGSWRLVNDAPADSRGRLLGYLTLAMLGLAFWQQIGHEITFTSLDHSLLFLIGGLTISAWQDQQAKETQEDSTATAQPTTAKQPNAAGRGRRTEDAAPAIAGAVVRPLPAPERRQDRRSQTETPEVTPHDHA